MRMSITEHKSLGCAIFIFTGNCYMLDVAKIENILCCTSTEDFKLIENKMVMYREILQSNIKDIRDMDVKDILKTKRQSEIFQHDVYTDHMVPSLG